jgi:hypothetical protein
VKAVIYSLLLEDCSSVEVILFDNSRIGVGSNSFCYVEMAYPIVEMPATLIELEGRLLKHGDYDLSLGNKLAFDLLRTKLF